MTPAARRTLARVLGALVPQRPSGQLAHDPQEAPALAERLETACRTAGIAARDAVRMADSLTSSLLGAGGYDGKTAAWTGKGTATPDEQPKSAEALARIDQQLLERG